MTVLTEQQEWDELVSRIPIDTPTREAANMLGELLADAVQAQRPWARQRLNEALHAGLSKVWRSHVQKSRPKVRTKQGEVKSVGGIRRMKDGQQTYVQVPLDAMSFEELVQYRAMHVSNLQALSANTKVVERLLALRDRCPKAQTAADIASCTG